MVTLRHVEEQLAQLGCKFRFFARAEVRELPHILMPDETILCAINGRYANGGALLVATNHRLLLIDKKPLFLAVEDIRFDMIAEVDFNARLLSSTARIITPTRELTFTSYNQTRLRELVGNLQARIIELRERYIHRQFVPGVVAGTRVTASHVGELALRPGRLRAVRQALMPRSYTGSPRPVATSLDPQHAWQHVR